MQFYITGCRSINAMGSDDFIDMRSGGTDIGTVIICVSIIPQP